ncbi:MAG: hypothetical protein ACAF41_34225 (plasmid) [Leptolyngbya sp. BL-A-14]
MTVSNHTQAEFRQHQRCQLCEMEQNAAMRLLTKRSPIISQQPILIGVVTIGTLWQFGQLDRESKLIQQDIVGYRLPQELEPIIRILTACLNPSVR